MTRLLDSRPSVRDLNTVLLYLPVNKETPSHLRVRRNLTAVCVSLLSTFAYAPEIDAKEANDPLKKGTVHAAHRCGVIGEIYQITGVVVSVHDGDSLTITDQGKRIPVRLKGIDAPELSQPFGSDAREVLAGLVLNQAVTVTYSKKDRYGRLIGRVHTDACVDVGLHQLTVGMAWFYSVFQCELPKDARSSFQRYQDEARAAGIGLWSQKKLEPPWVHRNSKDPAVPKCPD